MKNNGVLNQLVYENIYLTGSAPAKIYGLPNMHKFTPSNLFSELPPIVSSIGTCNYMLAKCLCEILSPHLSKDHIC